MDNNLENQILEFVQNRHEKSESTATRHVHIRFGIEIIQAEKIFQVLVQKNKILKYYDKDYDEDRYTPKKKVVKE